MAFQEQQPSGKFVAWGKKKAKEHSFVVEKDEAIEGILTEVKPSHKYGFIFTIKTKKEDEPLILIGNTSLRRGFGYEVDDEGERLPDDKQPVDYIVQEGDTVRVTFLGMTPTTKGKEAYMFKIEVDR